MSLQLEGQLESLEKSRTTEARSVRNVDRTVRDLQGQIERREKSAQLLVEDLDKSRERVRGLLSTIDELQASDSQNQLAARRAERELNEERENRLRLERELEGWKGLRIERGSVHRSATLAALSEDGRSRRGSSIGPPAQVARSVNGDGVRIEVPQRKSSLTKGFL